MLCCFFGFVCKYSLYYAFFTKLILCIVMHIDNQPCVTVMYDAGDGSGVCGGISVLL